MSFVPITGPATFRAGAPPREGVVEFTDDRRTITMPVRGAIPVLGRAHTRGDAHPSVALLAGAALMGMRLVAAGKLAPGSGPTAGHWVPSGLGPDDDDRIARLAEARRFGDLDEVAAERVVRGFVEAVVDAVPHGAPTPRERPASQFAGDVQARLARRARQSDLPHLVTIALRVEADEEELVAGSVRLVLVVQDERDPLHLCDAVSLWTDDSDVHGFGDRARTHASIALRRAAEAWPVLDRLLGLQVPDEIALDTDDILSLLDDGVAALQEIGVSVLWPRTLGHDLTSRVELARTQPRDAPLQDPVFGTEALFSFRWQLALHGDPLTDDEMDRLARAAGPVLRLRGNWTVVDPALTRRARKRLIARVPATQAVAAALTGAVEVGDTEHEVVLGASLLAVREQLRTAATREPVPAPAGLQATLRDYQRHGLTWLAQLTGLGLGGCLADDMGLGKTITVLALVLHRAEQAAAGEAPPAGPTLVVCPTSLLGTWEAEARRFAPGLPVRRFHGSRRDLDGVADTAGLVLTTYGTLRNDVEGAGALLGPAWDLLVADEAQHVKNARSATARAVRRPAARARVALTGTPVENDLTDLWSILDLAVPGLLGSRLAFRKVWAAPIESGVEPAKARQFAELISPFLLRRRKSDPGIAPELPPKTETDHLLALTHEQVVLYEAYVRDCMERIERADEHARRGLVLAMLTGLKQICNHPAQFLKQANPRLGGRSQKLDLLDEVVGTVLAEDGAVLVFTQYVAMARLVAAHLSRAAVPHQLLHGGTPAAEREAMVARFQAGAVPVFLLSLKAGGTGLTLTRADHVVHLDRWWNPAVEDQATDRAYRIGQTKPVQVHRLVVQGTVEERVAGLLERKRSLADAVLARGEGALTELDDAELRDLVSYRPS